MNGFFASVELLDHPELKDKPMAVAGDATSRHGIILAKNEIAKKYGVSTAETIWQAKKKCPNLQLVSSHHDKYRQYSVEINKIYLRYTDLVEPFSIDESWLDVTASQKLLGDGKKIADDIRATVKKELGLTLSAGVSYNKIFAKMGSEYKKPDATTVITRENYKSIIWPQDVGDMFFVGKATAAKLKSMGIMTIGDMAITPRTTLISMLGKQGGMLYDYVNGLEDSPVHHYSHREPVKSVGNGITFRRNLEGLEDIKTALSALSDTVSSRLRKYALKAGGIKVDIKDPNFTTISRQKQLDVATNSTLDVYRYALSIIESSWDLNKPIRLITLTAINLQDEGISQQLSMFAKEDNRLDNAMDTIRDKFGKDSISFGQVLKSDIGVTREGNTHETDEEA
ncbi:MAG: DNA polymerase IV [Clostridia bacterium]|nr:DNA polymerase IV [Clostridia bacterium]